MEKENRGIDSVQDTLAGMQNLMTTVGTMAQMMEIVEVRLLPVCGRGLWLLAL